MTDQELEQIVREHLDKSYHMSLATCADGRPWVCEVHFAWDDELNLYFVSKPSTRHCQELAANPNVAGNIVKQHPLSEYPHAIYFEGTAEQVIEPTDQDVQRYAGRLNRDVAGLASTLRVARDHQMYKITVRNWAAFGKFGRERGEKYVLKWSDVS